MLDHVHLMLAIPPKYAVLQVMGYIKGKSTIHLPRVYGKSKQNFVGQNFWGKEYFVLTVQVEKFVGVTDLKAEKPVHKKRNGQRIWVLIDAHLGKEENT